MQAHSFIEGAPVTKLFSDLIAFPKEIVGAAMSAIDFYGQLRLVKHRPTSFGFLPLRLDARLATNKRVQ